jgi:hypothetical protein
MGRIDNNKRIIRMGHTWRSIRGAKVVDGDEAIHLEVTTADGRDRDVEIAPELVTQLVAELLSARSKAIVKSSGPREARDPSRMQDPILAQELRQTDYIDRGRSLIQIILSGGGVIEALIPLGRNHQQEIRG